MSAWPWHHKRTGEARDGPLDFWDLSRPVFAFGNSPVTLNHLTTGVQVFGQPGSDKTTGSGRFFLEQFMRLGMGGLILTAKEDDTRLYRKYARLFGRERQLAVFSAKPPSDSDPQSDSTPRYTFNPFQWEYSRPSQGAGHTANLVSLFMGLVEAMERKPGQKASQGGGEDSVFWNRSLELALTNSVDLVTLALNRISVMDLYRVISSTAYSPDVAKSEGWRSNSYCFHPAILTMDDLPPI